MTTETLAALTADEFADGCGYRFRGVDVVENEDGTSVFAYGHIDPSLFAQVVNDHDVELGGVCWGTYTAEQVQHVYATTERPASDPNGWWITWGGQPENTATTPGAFPLTVVSR